MSVCPLYNSSNALLSSLYRVHSINFIFSHQFSWFLIFFDTRNTICFTFSRVSRFKLNNYPSSEIAMGSSNLLPGGFVLAEMDLRSMNCAREVLAEFVGSFFLIIIGVGGNNSTKLAI